ncbi:helix-turn-helix domain-containing protein [Luteimonas sp. SX5]|uniref:DNA-3-methyladenine glycosylase II n=1 Tax=Luteimonas galliterrae TaxID=2940486 RepID=A0ABT0MHD4_9GAMM|nr:DNA-3-methyladenine glycosylase 2 [Luteimonas galliterrae]MCL1634291.1 helix-turn-helix domain-containing protein [Luteimonas galliterrae]
MHGMPTPEICNRARIAHDPRFDGLFFIAVRSTGIYCRPVCPAPTAKRENVVFYPTAAAAVAMGYRPCLRCRPELSPEAFARIGEETVQRALGLIAEGALQDGSVEQLAERVGVCSRQLRRLFVARTGATPIVVHTTRRMLLAKQLLTETSLPVTQVALAAGFNSLRRFNAAFREGCGMPPTAIRRQRAEAPGGALTLRLGYRPPLDFPAMLAFLSKRALPGIERVTDSSYERIVGPAEAPTLIHVSADAAKPELLLRIEGPDPRVIPDIVRRVRRIFDLDADLRAVHAVLRSEPLLAQAIKKRPGLRVPGGWDGFELAVRAVLGQQVSVAGATTLARRLVDAYGEPCKGGQPGLDRVFPQPERLIGAPLELLGLPKSRATTLRSLARAMADGRIDFGAGQRLDDFVERFTALPGIGPWTAQYVAMRALSQPDAFPAGDLVLQQVLGGATSGDGLRLTERATAARAEAWRPWRAYAVLQLWHLAGDHAVAKTEQRKKARVVR